ncbi:hypothetical protein BCR44DRAFT_92183 [Catenaria anguillulae PL171]|uniref:Uncharacterized protein n=1 Tax=Catenaria anguillulae PL171 TaxID=765915 RepID=A0A1Y2HM43_9FUNG|nr:hypothetical protein BCR44DRAFT_92183 [Catenaria anguillulae PL171]
MRNFQHNVDQRHPNPQLNPLLGAAESTKRRWVGRAHEQHLRPFNHFFPHERNNTKLAQGYALSIRTQQTETKPSAASCSVIGAVPTIGNEYNHMTFLACKTFALKSRGGLLVIGNRSKEIERLQRVFSQDDAPSSPDDIKVKKLKPRATTDDEPLDPMKELLQEIEERHEFLKAMERLGKADEYRLQVQTEINLRVRQMEVMAKKLDEQDKSAVKLPKLS